MKTSIFAGAAAVVLILAVLSGPVTTAPRAQEAGNFKNVKVLTDLTPAQLNTEMQAWVKALGVKCSFCHEAGDFGAEGNEHKGIARKMVTMVRSLNSEFFKDSERKMSCVICHRGSAEIPESLP